MLAAIVLFPFVVITVPSGQVGVLWKRFNGYDLYCWCFVGRGTILDPRELRDEGLHIIWPWDKLYLYNLRLQSTTQTYNAISKDGVNVTVADQHPLSSCCTIPSACCTNSSARSICSRSSSPEIGSQAREVISEYTAQQVYTSREAIQDKIRSNAQKSLGAHLNSLVQPEAMEQPDPKHYNDFLQNAIQILDTLVLSIELPPAIVAAINRQTEQYYQIQEFKYRVEREAQESRRKQIEANGIAAFQQTVSQGISDSYLRWRGIEATLGARAIDRTPKSSSSAAARTACRSFSAMSTIRRRRHRACPRPAAARRRNARGARRGQDIGGASGYSGGREFNGCRGRSAKADLIYPARYIRYRRHPVPHARKPEPDQIGDR